MSPRAGGDARSRAAARLEGARGEDAAAAHATRHGARVVARNFRVREGELDLVLDDRGVLAFAEVKTRSRATDHAAGLTAVTSAKRARVGRAALCFLRSRGLDPHGVPCRFDVLSVRPTEAGWDVLWLKGAFDADDRWLG